MVMLEDDNAEAMVSAVQPLSSTTTTTAANRLLLRSAATVTSRSLQFGSNDDDLPMNTTTLTAFWHIVSAMIWICVLYQIYKSRFQRRHGASGGSGSQQRTAGRGVGEGGRGESGIDIYVTTADGVGVGGGSSRFHPRSNGGLFLSRPLTEGEILQRQVRLIEQASKRREQLLHRFHNDHTIMARFN